MRTATQQAPAAARAALRAPSCVGLYSPRLNPARLKSRGRRLGLLPVAQLLCQLAPHDREQGAAIRPLEPTAPNNPPSRASSTRNRGFLTSPTNGAHLLDRDPQGCSAGTA